MNTTKILSLLAAGSLLSFSALAADSSNSSTGKTTPKSPNRAPMSMQGQQNQGNAPEEYMIIAEEDDYFMIPKKGYMDKSKCKGWKDKAKKRLKHSKEQKEKFFAKKKEQLQNMSQPEKDWVLEQAYFVIDTLND